MGTVRLYGLLPGDEGPEIPRTSRKHRRTYFFKQEYARRPDSLLGLRCTGHPDEPRDVSAATVAASALYELSTFSADSVKYRAWADRIIDTLSANYLVLPGTMHGFLLRSSTGHKPGGTEIDVPIVYADYYFLEALLRKQRLERGKPVNG